MNINKKILIFGGGIAGLTAAHELLDKGLDVTLVEKDNLIGGMAKSRRENGRIPSEHSWRGYAPFYKNTFEIMKRIPIISRLHNETVYDNLTIPINFYILRDELLDYKPGLNSMDYIFARYYGIKHLLSNNRRRDHYKTKLIPLLKNKLSKDGYDFLVEFFVGPGLGMEKKDVSYGHFYDIMLMFVLDQEPYVHVHNIDGTDKLNSGRYEHRAIGRWHGLNAPTNEAWFDPWITHLKSKGLKVLLNTELVKFNFDKNNITSCIILTNNTHQELRADEYIVAINPFNAQDVFMNSEMPELYKQHILSNRKTISNQISFRLGFDKNIIFPLKNIAFAMADSEFNITWYPQEKHWKNGVFIDSELKSLWSGTIINTYSISKLYNKPALQLTKEQLINDIIYQILRSKSFQKLFYDSNGYYLDEKDIVYKEIWYEWEYHEDENILKQKNKKWINNIYNEEYRLSQKTNYKNLYLSGAHTKTSIGIWSMEGAVESGKLASNLILKYDNAIYYKHKDPTYIRAFQDIDDRLYSIGLPSILDIMLIIIIIIIIYIIRIS